MEMNDVEWRGEMTTPQHIHVVEKRERTESSPECDITHHVNSELRRFLYKR